MEMKFLRAILNKTKKNRTIDKIEASGESNKK